MNRVYDGMIGLAVGDALGVPVEFKSRLEIAENPVAGMRGYGTHNQPPGTWSDDTSLTLAFLDSIVQKKGIDYNDIMERFSDWLMEDKYTAAGKVFDAGNATRNAIINYGRGKEPLECGGVSERENGNGSLMRILPLAYYLITRPDLTMEYQMETVHHVSSLTHRHPISLIGCGIYISIAVKLLAGGLSLYTCIGQGIEEAVSYYADKQWKDIDKYQRLGSLEKFSGLPESDIRSSGYVVDTLESALWCLLKTDSYIGCVLKAVNLGGDTDTVGAVAGGLAGIYYGADSIPKEWLDAVAGRQYIETLCESFAREEN